MFVLYLHNGTVLQGAGGLGFCCVDGCDRSTGGDGWLTVHGALLLPDKTLLSASVQRSPKPRNAVAEKRVRRQQTEPFDSRSSDAHIQAVRGKLTCQGPT